MASVTSYDTRGYNNMIASRPRTVAYLDALRQAITPGSVVVEIGTGTGLFACLACQLGASRVYAIEPAEIIEIAKAVAVENGWGRRIHFVQDVSTGVELSEKADVIISDLRGVLPMLGTHIPSVIDARERLLAANGILMPRRDELWMTLVESERLYASHSASQISPEYPQDLSVLNRVLANGWSKQRVRVDECVAVPQRTGVIDYQTVASPNICMLGKWTLDRACTIHGIASWFDAEIVEGIGFSNAPSAPEVLYGHAFFPMETPLNAHFGDVVVVELEAFLVDGEYQWRWKTALFDPDFPPEPKAASTQSSLSGAVFALERLRRKADDYIPPPPRDRDVVVFSLECADGGTSLGEIAHKLLKRFPGRFKDWKDSFSFVAEVIDKAQT